MEPTKRELKVGDRVCSTNECVGPTPGTLGTIMGDDGSGFCNIIVAFDGWYRGHDANGDFGLGRHDLWYCGEEDLELVEESPIESQIGGDHYKARSIQPIQYILSNGLGFCEGNVVKYVTRWKDKGGVEDLKKARHYIDFLIEDAEKSND